MKRENQQCVEGLLAVTYMLTEQNGAIIAPDAKLLCINKVFSECIILYSVLSYTLLYRIRGMHLYPFSSTLSRITLLTLSQSSYLTLTIGDQLPLLLTETWCEHCVHTPNMLSQHCVLSPCIYHSLGIFARMLFKIIIHSFIHLFHIPLILYRCGTSHVYISCTGKINLWLPSSFYIMQIFNMQHNLLHFV